MVHRSLFIDLSAITEKMVTFSGNLYRVSQKTRAFGIILDRCRA